MFSQWRHRLPTLSAHGTAAQLWRDIIRDTPFLAVLNVQEQHRLGDLAMQLLGQKTITAARGLVLTDAICLKIAAQACLPILNLGLDFYAGWSGIVVYPHEFIVPLREQDEAGVEHTGHAVNLGQTFPGGPVVLALDFDRDERFVVNAIIHEFAHKLDMLNGDADGIPPLHADMDPRLWSRVLLTAGWRHALRLDTEAADVIDPVAAESAAEFFAVASEVFFERPRRLRRHYPRLYQQFCRFYRQDPAARYRAGFINQPKQESQDAS